MSVIGPGLPAIPSVMVSLSETDFVKRFCGSSGRSRRPGKFIRMILEVSCCSVVQLLSRLPSLLSLWLFPGGTSDGSVFQSFIFSSKLVIRDRNPTAVNTMLAGRNVSLSEMCKAPAINKAKPIFSMADRVCSWFSLYIYFSC